MGLLFLGLGFVAFFGRVLLGHAEALVCNRVGAPVDSMAVRPRASERGPAGEAASGARRLLGHGAAQGAGSGATLTPAAAPEALGSLAALELNMADEVCTPTAGASTLHHALR